MTKTDSKDYLTKSYFDNYPLITSKYIDYLCFLKDYIIWENVYQEIVNVQKVKNTINKNKSYFNWNHLQKIKKTVIS